MPLGMEVGFGPDDFVLDGEQVLSPKRGRNPPILGPCLLWPNGWMDQDALGMEVDLGPGNIVLDGDPAPLPKKGQTPSNFRPISIVAKRLYVSTIRIPRGTEETSAQATLY